MSYLTRLRSLEYLERVRKFEEQARSYVLHIAVYGSKYEMSVFLALCAMECYDILRLAACNVALLECRFRYPFPGWGDG